MFMSFLSTELAFLCQRQTAIYILSLTAPKSRNKTTKIAPGLCQSTPRARPPQNRAAVTSAERGGTVLA